MHQFALQRSKRDLRVLFRLDLDSSGRDVASYRSIGLQGSSLLLHPSYRSLILFAWPKQFHATKIISLKRVITYVCAASNIYSKNMQSCIVLNIHFVPLV